MSRLMKLQNQKAALLAEMKELTALCTTEDRAMTEDEQAKFNTLDDRCTEASEGITFETRIQQRELEMATMADVNSGTEVDKTAKEFAEAANPKTFESFGDQLSAVVKAGTPGGVADPRLTIEAATGLGESVGSEGGFLVQTDFVSQLITPIFEGGAIASRVSKIPIGGTSNGVKINAINQTSRKGGSRWGGILAYWLSEAGTKSATKPEYRQLEISLNKLIGLCYSTDELLQDTVALQSVITQGFQDEFTFMVEDAIFEGTGAGQPLGILNSPCIVQVNKEVGQAAATIVAENIQKMYARMHARSLPKAVWLINQDTWPQLFQLSLAVGTGGVPMFIPAGTISSTPAGSLLGRPIIPVEYCETLGTVGDIVFADFSQYLLGDKGGVKADTSIHVRFIYDETAFRFVYRVDGQPIWNSPLTPFKGTTTQSPFIKLQTRS